MGVCLIATQNDEYRAGERIGSCGAQRALLAILLAGYGVGHWPEARRVRDWLRVADEHFYGDDYFQRLTKEAPGLPLAYDFGRRSSDLKQLIAYNHDDQHWITLRRSGQWPDTRTGALVLAKGLGRRPARCPILQGLVLLYQASCYPGPTTGSPKLQDDKLEQAATAVCMVLPELQASCWYDKVARVAALLTRSFTAEWVVSFSF